MKLFFVFILRKAYYINMILLTLLNYVPITVDLYFQFHPSSIVSRHERIIAVKMFRAMKNTTT